MSDVPLPGRPVRGSATGRPVMALFDLLGRAWSMGIIWQLDGGPYTFRQLQDACGNVSPTLLNRRLKELRANGLVELGPGGYELTELGQQLFGHIEPFGSWAKTWATAVTGQDWDHDS